MSREQTPIPSNRAVACKDAADDLNGTEHHPSSFAYSSPYPSDIMRFPRQRKA